MNQLTPPSLASLTPRTLSRVTAFILLSLMVTGLGNPPAYAGKSVRTGDQFPDLDWMTVDGETLGFDELSDGRSVVMVFWATWCAVCKKDWPELTALSEEFEGEEQSPRWVAVSVRDNAAKAKKVAAERHLPGVQLNDPEEVAFEDLGLKFIPHVIVVRADGTVAYSDKPRIGKLRKLLTKLAESPPPVKDSR